MRFLPVEFICVGHSCLGVRYFFGLIRLSFLAAAIKKDKSARSFLIV